MQALVPGRPRPQRSDWIAVRQLADQAFSRASGAPLREGNVVRLLRNGAENYPAWLDAIADARQTIHFEMYIIHEDDQGRRFAEALADKARQGVRVRLLYDWMGGFGKTSRAFWRRLRDAGVDVRCYNPPRIGEPFGWVSRDHRKLIVVDDTTAFVTGLCIGQAWVGNAAKREDPWRDTGIAVRGPAVADIQAAFAEAWDACGAPLPERFRGATEIPSEGPAGLRVVATVPYTAGMFRVDQLVAAMARKTLWLTDAYYGGTTSYVQALRAAAQDGVDVRLLVPGASDIPLVRLFSRAGYRPLLDAGVRVFEWNGTMIHAKSAVADGLWARVGSTNLNVASWMGNRELDVIVEHPPLAEQMAEMFLDDLSKATEVVLTHNRVRVPLAGAGAARRPKRRGKRGRIVAGVVRVGRTVAAAITSTRLLEPVEANIALTGGLLVAGVAALVLFFPRVAAYPLAVVLAWIGVSLFSRGLVLLSQSDQHMAPSELDAVSGSEAHEAQAPEPEPSERRFPNAQA